MRMCKRKETGKSNLFRNEGTEKSFRELARPEIMFAFEIIKLLVICVFCRSDDLGLCIVC